MEESEEASREPLSLTVYQVDLRHNIHLVKLSVDQDNYQLKIEKVTAPTPPPTPVNVKRSLSHKFSFGLKSPLSPKASLSSKSSTNQSISQTPSPSSPLPSPRLLLENGLKSPSNFYNIFNFNFRRSRKYSQDSMNSFHSNNNIPEVIPLDEIQEFRNKNLDSKSTPASILQQLGISTVCNRKSLHSKFKVGTLLFGKQFNLKKHTFIIVEPVYEKHEANSGKENKELWKSWLDRLQCMIQEYKSMTYLQRMDLWYKTQYEIALEKTLDNHRLKIWKHFLSRSHYRVTTQNLKIEYEVLDPLLRKQCMMWCTGQITSEEFDIGARYFLHSRESIDKIFKFFGYDDNGHSNALDLLVRANDMQLSEHSVLKIFMEIMKQYVPYIKKYGERLPTVILELDGSSSSTKAAIKGLYERVVELGNDFIIEERLLCSNYLLDYLFSENNTIWNPDLITQYQDMDRPLAHYWVFSSHNSYLTGDQYSSESSIEAYARILLSGCKCIEIDAHNGPFCKPIVKHGNTLTTSVPLKSVLQTVKEYAFVRSPYPLIISVENHCNLRQQRTMAKYFRKIFGKALVTMPLETTETGEIQNLPSPNQLKYKVIIKGRNLPKVLTDVRRSADSMSVEPTPQEGIPGLSSSLTPPGGSVGTLSSTENIVADDGDANPCDCLMTGELFIKNDNGEWMPCIFVLTNKKLFYTEREIGEDDWRFSKTPRRYTKYFRHSVSSVDSYQDLHMDQMYFHGRVPGGRLAADQLLSDYARTGAFLVRESGVNVGGYTLCFYGTEKVHHCHIITRTTNDGEKLYHLRKDPAEFEIFTSLFELIEYYKNHPVVTNECRLERLGPPVPPSASHEAHEWFYKHIDRKGAQTILERLPINGAFLGRYSSDNPGEIVISFRYESVIKHCLIKLEGRELIVSNLKFNKLEDLVEHYSRHEFYRNIKLKHPIGKELYKKSQQSDCSQRVYSCPEYVDSFVKTVKGTVRAVQSYKSEDPDYLSFKKGDKIMDVVKESGGWWWGIKEDQMGEEDVQPKLFCASFVEDCEELDGPFGQYSSKGMWDVGSRVTWKLCKDTNLRDMGFKFYIKFKYPDGSKKKLGAKCSKRKVNEWVEMINHVVAKDIDGKIKSAKEQAKHNVASEYSELIVYCASTDRLCPEEIGRNKENINVTLVKSLDEVSGGRLFRSKPSFFVWYHQYAITRIYPKGYRLDSSNFSPVRFWNFGSQIVALNCQTDDKAMQLNRGKFRQNGNCGYVLKPDLMFPDKQEKGKVQFDPTRMNHDDSWNPINLKIEIISARHLEKQGNGSITPIVEVEVVGVDADCSQSKTPTAVIDTGLNPCWNHSISFTVRCPELALLQFAVCHVDTFSDKLLLGECTIPINCIREGYRSVQLKNSYGEPVFSILLVKITKESVSNGDWNNGNTKTSLRLSS